MPMGDIRPSDPSGILMVLGYIPGGLIALRRVLRAFSGILCALRSLTARAEGRFGYIDRPGDLAP